MITLNLENWVDFHYVVRPLQTIHKLCVLQYDSHCPNDEDRLAKSVGIDYNYKRINSAISHLYSHTCSILKLYLYAGSR